MQRVVANTASQKGHTKFADIKTLMFVPFVISAGNVVSIDPKRGTSKLKTDLTRKVMRIRTTTKSKIAYKGFL